jgi:hypothetical protein
MRGEVMMPLRIPGLLRLVSSSLSRRMAEASGTIRQVAATAVAAGDQLPGVARRTQ